jgi:primosomal protein N' (replication factor Y)
VLDAEPLLDERLMALLEWASSYYQHPPGEVFAAALPRLLRTERSGESGLVAWRITPSGQAALAGGELARAPVQQRLLEALDAAGAEGLATDELEILAAGWREASRQLQRKGWTVRMRREAVAAPCEGKSEAAPEPTPAQAAALATIVAARGFQAFLLEGVTGSGKTEVYLRAIAARLAAGRQSLVIVPEIGLTPQLVERFRRRFSGTNIALLHSGLTDRQRLAAWLGAREGKAEIIIGTRSAVFVPLPRPGLIVIDEEHDLSLKQQDGFRYSARDIAVWRARQLGVPIVLGSATPSLETLANAGSGRYQRLRLPERTGTALPPRFHLVDLRRQAATDGLTPTLLAAMERHLGEGGQVLLYLNRRGYAPVLLCPACGHCLECPRCDARLVLHRRENRLTCHHCGSARPVPTQCPECSGELLPVGQGTERLEAAITEYLPGHALLRIDRDTTRGRGEIERRLGEVAAGRARILLGTQMLTKGHDFPDVTLVGIIDADQGLFGTDFRAGERLAQTIVQVAGRAGRGERPGEVYIQTLFPDHPLLQLLVREGYERFGEAALEERRAAGWPPFSHLALLRAEAPEREPAMRFLEAACGAGAPARTGKRTHGKARRPLSRAATRRDHPPGEAAAVPHRLAPADQRSARGEPYPLVARCRSGRVVLTPSAPGCRSVWRTARQRA